MHPRSLFSLTERLSKDGDPLSNGLPLGACRLSPYWRHQWLPVRSCLLTVPDRRHRCANPQKTLSRCPAAKDGSVRNSDIEAALMKVRCRRTRTFWPDAAVQRPQMAA